MLEAHFGLEGIKHGLDEKAFAEHDFVIHGHQIILHISTDTCDEMQATPPEFLEQCFVDITFVGKSLAREVPCYIVHHGSVVCVARSDFQGHDLALMIDDEVQLEAEKPPHAGLAAGGQAIEDFMAMDAAIVTDGELA